MKLNVTIARQLGSGGSEVGKMLAEALDIRCIDREIISRTAQQSHLSETEIANREEKVSSFWERMLNGFVVGAPEAAYIAPPFQTFSDQEIFIEETKVLKSISKQEDCVIVGRGAVHVLAQHARSVNIFLYAPLSFRIPRVMDYYQAPDEASAREMIERSDTMRGKSISQMTGQDWTEASNYHLCIDTSTLPLPEIAELLVKFVKQRCHASQIS